MRNASSRDVLPRSALLGRIALLFPKRFAEWTGRSGPAVRLLFLLEQRGEVSQAEIERDFAVDGATVTRLAKQLEAEGLIQRAPHPEDNRFTVVRLTAAGRQALAEVRAQVPAFEEAVFAGIAPEDLSRCRAVLDRIGQNLTALRPPQHTSA